MAKRFLIGFLIVFSGFWIFFFVWSPGFLTYNHPVNSSTILLEGWLPPYEIEQAIRQHYLAGKTKLVICGKKFKTTDQDILSRVKTYFDENEKPVESFKNGIWLLTNSSLFFKVDDWNADSNRDTLLFRFRLKGSSANGYTAHYTIYINDKPRIKDFVSVHEEVIVLPWPKDAGPVTSLCLQFDNDLKTETQDRNLKVVGLSINQKTFPLDNRHVFNHNHKSLSVFGYASESEFIKNYLLSLGVDAKDMVLLQFDPAPVNQTLMSAKVSADWAKQNRINSINIISSGIHSRRSWISYKRTFPESMDVGVINYPSTSMNKKQVYHSFPGILTGLDELFTYLWNWVQLSF